MNKKENRKDYIGDGVYCDFNGYAFVLTSENGVQILDRIVLEPQVYEQLKRYVERVMDDIKHARQEEEEMRVDTIQSIDKPSDALPSLTTEECDECGTYLINRCIRCGAPVCCPKCCQEQEAREAESAKEER